jgi:hypothetical protein
MKLRRSLLSLLPVFPHVIHVAGLTESLLSVSARNNHHITLAQRVAALAVSLARILGGRSLSAQRVRSIGDGFKVRGVDASTHTTQVVDVEPVRNGAAKRLVGNAVRACCSVVHADHGVPISGFRPLPDPTTRNGVHLDTTQNNVGRCCVCASWHDTQSNYALPVSVLR